MSRYTTSKRHVKRVLIGLIGFLVLLVGIIAIPYPGPGWLLVISGLAILATEFDWAQRLLERTKSKYEMWREWMKRQSLSVKILFWIFTMIVVVATVYFFNGYGYINDWLHLGYEWLQSPLPLFDK